MILVKLRGGLSNQMFQYAAAKRLAVARDTEVRIDASWYSRIPNEATSRRYELSDAFLISGTLASRWEIIGTDGIRSASVLDLPVALWRKARPWYRFAPERQFHFDPSVLDLPDGACMFGYFVSEKYFVDIADVIRQEFQFRDPPSPANARLMEDLSSCNSVAVHVRRGDYASSPSIRSVHGLCGVDYYDRCVRAMRARVDDPTFYVFSDDLDWAADNLQLGDQAVFVDHNRGDSSREDLRLMASSRHNIIANSGFSWWGAWLNPNPSKCVFAPIRWMQDDALDTNDVLPESWSAA